jgi:hypothetical protein
MLKAAILFFGLLLVGAFYFQDDIAHYARQMARGKGAGYTTSPSVGKGMTNLGDALGNQFKSFGEGLKK